METIGTTGGGNMLVSMTDEEHTEFRRLEDVVNGLAPNMNFVRSPLGLRTDLGSTFGAIRAFAEAKFRLNELEEVLVQLRLVVEGRKKDDDDLGEAMVTGSMR